MCSMTWHRHPGGYEVFFNRDEKKTRQRATPPALQVLNGVRFLAPQDGDAGGTWLLANEHGVTLALLNLWGAALEPRPARPSRGRLLSDLLPDARDAEEAMNRVQSHALAAYPGFTLAAFDLSQTGAPLGLRWDGQRVHSLPLQMPVCSSSFDPEVVESFRARHYQQSMPQTLEDLWHWHSHEEQPTACTVRMNRPDAQTWSISHVQVGPGMVRWRYREEMPDFAAAPAEHYLDLSR